MDRPAPQRSRRSVLWLRRDLRRADLPALLAAAEAGPDGVAVVFVIDPTLWERGGQVRRAWLAATLRATSVAYGGRLVLRVGDPREVIPQIAAEVGAASVHVSRETTPVGRRRDAVVRARLAEAGVEWVETGTPYAVGPGIIRTATGTPFQVFTPFAKAWRAHGWPLPADSGQTVDTGQVLALASDDAAEVLIDAALTAPGLPDLPPAGEAAALERWRQFLDAGLAAYADDRDRPDRDGTSRLSPYLKLGVVHPRTLLRDLAERAGPGVDRFVTELAWREFYADVLWHTPASTWSDLKPTLAGLTYDDGQEAIEAWRQGRTGYPIVDAGMRQLLGEGWMHNRVRMITASFLTKDLHVWWPIGARHFLDHLIDGDMASNSHGWQWVAGTGTDAAPYFRVFNPVTQGLRFDPEGEYVRRWVPELAHVPGPLAHEPWRASDGYAEGYPARIVDHAEGRAEALARYAAVRA